MKASCCVTTTENLYISDRFFFFCAHNTNQTPVDVGKSCFPDGSAVLHQGAYFVLGYNCLRLFTRSEGLCMTYVHKPHTNRKILAAPAKRLHREKMKSKGYNYLHTGNYDKQTSSVSVQLVNCSFSEKILSPSFET